IAGSDLPDSDSGHTLQSLREIIQVGGSFTQLPTVGWFDDPPSGPQSGPETRELANRIVTRLPVPDDWRRPDLPAEDIHLFGAGLGLFGIRSVPLVGREHERDELWGCLQRVHETNRPHVVALIGDSGTGKSRLAEWLSERAAEVGAGAVLTAFHGEYAAAGSGLAGMLRRALHAEGLEREALIDHLMEMHQERRRLADHADPSQALLEVMALADLMDPLPDTERPKVHRRVHFQSPAERFSVINRLLKILSRSAPLVIWLDDIHWSQESMEWVEFTLDWADASEVPILFLLTIQEQVLGAEARQLVLLERILERPNTLLRAVLPLDAANHRQLVEQLLPMESELAEQVATM
ncbi:MAG: ATP-binding protein, partial [Myxococcales bacterium]|nr:ATP-binding protein [Myxococcales bacterium]